MYGSNSFELFELYRDVTGDGVSEHVVSSFASDASAECGASFIFDDKKGVVDVELSRNVFWPQFQRGDSVSASGKGVLESLTTGTSMLFEYGNELYFDLDVDLPLSPYVNDEGVYVFRLGNGKSSEVCLISK